MRPTRILRGRFLRLANKTLFLYVPEYSAPCRLMRQRTFDKGERSAHRFQNGQSAFNIRK